ncbi:hypothetical protein [Budvicia aquatica]|uniref:hypothetical protein n=1 Tax=Budvicia aquatica TaxID=82979 RepID=UPI002089AD09|nr:hypothetical protein [Budvicia aquatica]GKX53861.1 hypothetical protein SOASR029_41700 [Budvicia aquatica]
MNKLIVTFGLVYVLLASQQALAVVSVRTSIDVTAEIASSVRVIYDHNADVTEGNVQVKLEDKNSYMVGMTKSFHFIGNANMVNLKLEGPTGLKKVGDPNNFIMPIGSTWYSSPTKPMSSTGFNAEAKVYATVTEIPATDEGIYIRFISAQRTETYPLGNYSGTYTLTVTPKS